MTSNEGKRVTNWSGISAPACIASAVCKPAAVVWQSADKREINVTIGKETLVNAPGISKHNLQRDTAIESDTTKSLIDQDMSRSLQSDVGSTMGNGFTEHVGVSGPIDDGRGDGFFELTFPMPQCDTGRKSSFMITRVIATKDLTDDLDDTTNTEDANSMALDVSRLTDSMIAEIPSSTDTLHTPDEEVQWPSSPRVGIAINPMLLPTELRDDAHSRFRIVKIESRDRWHRGRWTCHDFADPPVEPNVMQTERLSEDGMTSVSLPAGAPIYYIPGVHDSGKSPVGFVYCDSGVPVLEPSLLTSPLYSRNVSFFAEKISNNISLLTSGNELDNTAPSSSAEMLCQHTLSGDSGPNIGKSVDVANSPAVRQLSSNDISCSVVRPYTIPASDAVVNFSLSQLQITDSAHTDQQIISLPSVGSATNLVSMGSMLSRANSQILPLDAMMSATLNLNASDESNGSGAVAIDNKIEQAMDLVKSHLMFAVREEVDLLKEKIKELAQRNEILQKENEFLRTHASPETLASLPTSTMP